MIRFRTLIAVTVVSCLGQAHADTAFALQPTIGVSSSIQAGDPTAMTIGPALLPRDSFVLVPSLRLGIDFSSLLAAVTFSYSTAGVLGHEVDGITRVGLLIEPAVWHSDDARVHMYVLAGAGVVLMAGETSTMVGMTAMSSPFLETGVGLQLGVGGRYAVHPNFDIGLELLVQPDIVPLDAGTFVGSEVMVAFTGTFIAGDRSFPATH